DVAAVRFGRFCAAVDISAVNWKGGDDFLQRTLQDIAREVGGSRVLPPDPRRIAGEDTELARHLIEPDWALAIANGLVKRAMLAGKSSVGAGNALLTGRIDQQAEHQIGEFVTSRALDRPILPQPLVPGQDLLDDEVERARRLFTQPQEITLWVEQPIDM